MKNDTAIYPTTDFLICTVLLYFDHELNQIDKSNQRRCVFDIKKRKDTEQLIEKLHKGVLLVEPKRFQGIQKEIKSRLYN